MMKLKNETIKLIYERWSRVILDFIEDNPDDLVTASIIAKYFDWDLHLVRLVINEMLKNKILKVNKEKI